MGLRVVRRELMQRLEQWRESETVDAAVDFGDCPFGTGGIAALAGFPALEALAQSRKETLVVGIDISDSTELDPVRDLHYTPPMTVSACYDCLVTMTAGDYINLKPARHAVARTPDGNGWRFTLRDNVKFASGAPMTAADVKFSLDRVRYIQFSLRST
jgi:peptide/nickel transport system substrate-binding protein